MSRPQSQMEYLRRASARREFQVVSLFANIGGFEMGAMAAGAGVPLANENNKIAIKIHRRNFAETVLDDRDIRRISASPAEVAEFLAKANIAPGAAHCICGGNPCNRLTTLARVHNLAMSVPDTRQLFFDFARVVRWGLPMTAVGENVTALATRHPHLLGNFLDTIRFDDDGGRRYFAAYKVLCASHYGVPQKRRRLIWTAVRADVANKIGIGSDKDVLTLFPEPTTPLPLTVRFAWQGLHPTPAEVEPFRRAMSRGKIADVVRRLPFDPDDVIKPYHFGLSRFSWFTLERLSWDKPAPTLTARGLLPISMSGPLHPSQHRKLCVREVMRLFGVPDDFDFGSVSAADAVARMGLMIPQPLACEIFKSLRDRVFRPYQAANIDGIGAESAMSAKILEDQ